LKNIKLDIQLEAGRWNIRRHVIHSIHGVQNVEYAGPNTFQYYGLVRGFLNLDMIEEARACCDFLLTIQKRNGIFRLSLSNTIRRNWPSFTTACLNFFHGFLQENA